MGHLDCKSHRGSVPDSLVNEVSDVKPKCLEKPYLGLSSVSYQISMYHFSYLQFPC